jgi:hypothetical protein
MPSHSKLAVGIELSRQRRGRARSAIRNSDKRDRGGREGRWGRFLHEIILQQINKPKKRNNRKRGRASRGTRLLQEEGTRRGNRESTDRKKRGEAETKQSHRGREK